MSFKDNQDDISKLITDAPSTENWIKSNFNGLIGESRTKTLLLNYGFWISERSLDSNGADFIIQKGELNKDLLHTHTPSLAFIQCKYISKTSSVIEIDAKYIYNTNKKDELISKNGFLLIIHHDNKKGKRLMKCLTARDIDSYYQRGVFKDSLITSNKEPEQVRKAIITIKVKDLLEKEKWDSEKVVIDKINKELIRHELISKINKNKFMGPKPVKTEIEGSWDDEVIDALLQVKLTAYNLLEVAADYLVTLKQIIYETDPYQFEEEETVSTVVKFLEKFKLDISNLNHSQINELLWELNKKIIEHKLEHVDSLPNNKMDNFEHLQDSSEND